MKKENKNLCKWKKKDIEKHFDVLSEVVSDPEYICAKCARVSGKKKNLCNPKKINRT